MTKELHDIRAPIKLFRVAHLLQLSKDAIVEFLTARGYQLENRPNAELTDEMLQLVLEKFRKDLVSAEKRREKVEKVTHRASRAPSREVTPLAAEPPASTEVVEFPEAASPEAPELGAEEVEEVAPEPTTAPAAEEPAETLTPAPVELAPPEELPSEALLSEPEPPPQEVAHGEATSPATEPEVTVQGEPTAADTTVERRREVISVTPEGTIHAPPSPAGGTLRILGKITLPVEPRHRRRPEGPPKPMRTEPSARPSKPLRTEGAPERPAPKRPSTAPRQPAEHTKAPRPLSEAPPPPSQPAKPTKPTLKRKLTLGEESTPKPRRRRLLEEISREEIEEAIRQTFIGLEESGLQIRERFRQKRRAEREEKQLRLQQELEQQAKVLHLTEFLTTAELAQLLGVPASEIVAKCLQLGMMVTINQRLDRDTVTLIAADYGYEVAFHDVLDELELEEPDPPESLQPRPPIVTVMGHVDHGKTTLLDYIRQTNVVAGEAGGITQHIGAYQVRLPDGRLITFLDTPGHEAFTAMRARGAQVTDLVVLVVAADDAVMPQTVEAINHARAAHVPIIVAINKVDKPEANPDRIRQQLADHGVLVEEWGGTHQCVEISALTGKNVDLLLEKILLEAELLELRANPNRPARGTVIEAHLDKGKGPVATVIVQNGTLRTGDPIVVGLQYGRVRALYDERGNRLDAAPPSTPVQVTGLDGLPEVGDRLFVVEDERLARTIALRRQQLKREQQARSTRAISLGDLSQRIQAGSLRELRIILKADVVGSIEALTNALLRLSTDEVKVTILHSGVGPITEADVMLAAASEAVIIGFHVQPTAAARKAAEQEGVDIRTYRIIYECLDDIKQALEGLLSPEVREEILGHAEVRQVFHISRVGTVAGCYVTDGSIVRNARVRILRDGLPIHTGTIESLKRFKEDVREVSAGYECGLTVSGFEDFREGDVIEAFRLVEQKRSLHV